MAYSSIIEKFGECIDCAAQGDKSFKPIIADRCKAFHYNKYRREISAKKQQARQSAQRVKYLPANKEQLIGKEIIKDTMLELWYLARKLDMTGKCEECGAWTNKNNDKYYRWSVCHIVPKSLVKSVYTHFDNWIELCQIHHQEYDAGFERAKRMKCFELIKRKFQSFKDLIPPEELRKINPYLL